MKIGQTMGAEPSSLEHALQGARDTIARQTVEIERLRRRLAQERFAEDLREALCLAATAGTIAAPVTHSQLLEMIVETAADVINADAASLFLIDEERQELVFEVALGQKAEQVKRFRLPIGRGVAGLVALSGQPMAVSDADNDPRQASDIAQQVGYIPQNLLCVPLYHDDRVIGVLELLNKKGAPSFSPADMDSLGLFANQAAVAIVQSRTNRSLSAFLQELLASMGGIPDHMSLSLGARAVDFGAEAEENLDYRKALDLARLVREIAVQGENEAAACESILRSFATYLRSRSGASASRMESL